MNPSLLPPLFVVNGNATQLDALAQQLAQQGIQSERADGEHVEQQLVPRYNDYRQQLQRHFAFVQGQQALLELIARSTALDQILNELLTLIEQQSSGLFCTILLLSDDGKRVARGFGPSLPAPFLAAFNAVDIGPQAGSCGTAMFRKQLVIVSDIAQDPLWQNYREWPQRLGFRACWSSPILLDDDTVLGAFAMYYREARAPTEFELELTRSATHLARIAIVHDRQLQHMKSLHADLEKRVEERTAALSASNAELEAFAYSVSHDLRAPLHRINGFSEILEDECGDQLSDAGHEYLQQISKGVMQMRTLIDDLLRLSQLSQHKLQRRNIDVSHLARDIAAEISTTDSSRHVEWLIAPNLARSGDEGLLRIALSNLLQNAWKFTRKVDHARIEVGGTTDENGLLYVKDNGVGFDRSQAKRLFAPFQRFHSQSQFEGSGIGLAIVARIIRLHGGHIECRSEPDKGAQFFFSLSGNR